MVPFCFIVAIETGSFIYRGDHCHPAFAYNYIFLSRSDINLCVVVGLNSVCLKKPRSVHTDDDDSNIVEKKRRRTEHAINILYPGILFF